MNAMDREAAIIEEVRRNLIAEGYEVVVQPNRMLIPPFLEGYRPDALAFRSDKNLVVEVATQSPAAERKLRLIQQRLNGQPGWELRLIWSSVGETSRSLQATSAPVISNIVGEIDSVMETGHLKPAFLLAWAALEASGRALSPENLARPQTPARLVEQLGRIGAISLDEAKALRELISKRNRLVHGELKTDIRRKDVSTILEVVRRLSTEIADAA